MNRKSRVDKDRLWKRPVRFNTGKVNEKREYHIKRKGSIMVVLSFHRLK